MPYLEQILSMDQDCWENVDRSVDWEGSEVCLRQERDDMHDASFARVQKFTGHLCAIFLMLTAP